MVKTLKIIGIALAITVLTTALASIVLQFAMGVTDRVWIPIVLVIVSIATITILLFAPRHRFNA